MKFITLCILALLLSAPASAQVAVVGHPSVEQRGLDAPTLLDIYTVTINFFRTLDASGSGNIIGAGMNQTRYSQ